MCDKTGRQASGMRLPTKIAAASMVLLMLAPLKRTPKALKVSKFAGSIGTSHLASLSVKTIKVSARCLEVITMASLTAIDCAMISFTPLTSRNCNVMVSAHCHNAFSCRSSARESALKAATYHAMTRPWPAKRAKAVSPAPAADCNWPISVT